jgi:hypothetical protein
MYTPLSFIAVVSTLWYATTSALPQTSTTGVFVTRRQTSSAPSATADAKRYFHNCNGFLGGEKEAWDDANTLAKAALAWQAGANFQPDADLWMGNDSATEAFNTRISSKHVPLNINIRLTFGSELQECGGRARPQLDLA